MLNESGLRPCEYNVVVRMDPVEEKTAGGIILLNKTQEENGMAAEEGTLVAVSPLAFGYAEWPEDQPPPSVGDRVMIARFQGRLIERGGVSYRIVKDADVIAVVETPAALAAAA